MGTGIPDPARRSASSDASGGRPAVAFDELAHTNVPGSGPHAKRWEDVMDLLSAGIDVITTVNIQHLESLADTVESMTGTPVRERVPDWVVRRADQIELVDASPEALRRRMLHGNIYPPEKVPEALSHFFRTDHLAALRELALRFLADEVDEALLNRLAGEQTDRVWETAERILVAVSAAPGTEGLVRRAARLASRVKGQLTVLHVATGEGSGEARRRLEALRVLASDVGANWVEVRHDDPARALTEYARVHQMTQLVVGASLRSSWSRWAGRSFIARVLSAAGQAGIDVHVIARRDTS
jgi:two-component system sensor histidine kinase KdpD